MARRLNKKVVGVLTVLGMLVLAAIGFALILNLPGQDPARYAAEAKQLAEKKEYSRAMQTYLRAYLKDPGRNPEYLVSAADAAIEDGKLAFARGHLDQALVRDSRLTSALRRSTELEFELAKMSGEKPQWGRVLDVACRLLEVDQESPVAHHAVGVAYLVLQADDESYLAKGEASLKRALELDPNNADVVKDAIMQSWVDAAKKAGTKTEVQTLQDAALSNLSAAVKRFEESGESSKAVDLKELHARLLLQRGSWEEALALLQELVQKETTRATGHLLLAQVYATARPGAGEPLTSDVKGEPDFAKSVAVLEEGLKVDPKNADLYYFLGDMYRRLGKFPEVEACYRRALEEIPYKDHFRSHQNNRMRIEFITALFQQELDHAAQLLTSNAKTQAEPADEAAKNDALSAAEAWIAKLKEEVDEQSLGVRYMTAALYRSRGEIVAAISEAEAAGRMARADQHFGLQTLLAELYMRRQQWGAARKALESAMMIRPDVPNVIILLASVHLELGEPEQAVFYLKPLTRGPMRDFLLKDQRAAKLRIRAYELLGQIEEAKKENEFLSQDTPEDVVRRADLAKAEGHAQEGEDLLKQALANDPENADLLAALARLYVSTNQTEQAQTFVQQLLAKDPANALYRRLEVLVMPPQADDAARDAKILQIIKDEQDDFTRAMWLAGFYRTRKKADDEVKQLDAAEKLQPNHPDVIDRQLMAALISANWPRADQYIAKYRQLNLDGTEGRIAAGRLALAKGTTLDPARHEDQRRAELQMAVKLFKEGLEKQPSFSMGWTYLADAHLRLNQIEEGKTALERALEIDPTNGLACRTMAQIGVVRSDDTTEAKYLALAAKFLPNDSWVEQRLQILKEKENPQAGIAAREETREQQPDNVENLVLLARLYGDPTVAEYGKAAETFLHALELSQDDLGLAREAAMFLGSEPVDRPADGEALLKRLLDNTDDSAKSKKAQIAIYLGQFYEAQKTLSLADRHFRMAVSWDPSPDTFILGAEFYTRNNRGRDALEYYERSLKQIDDNSESAKSVRARMIGLLLSLGDLETAQQKIDDYLRRYPDDAQGLVFLGAIHRMAGDIEKSKAAFDAFLAKRPDDPLALWQRAQLYMLMERWQAAIVDLAKSKVNKPDAFGYEHRIALADALLEVGRDQQAVAELRSILDEHPEEQRVAEALADVYLRARPPQYADTENLVISYMRSHPKETRWPMLLGKLGQQSQDWKKAVRGYEAAAELARYGSGTIPKLFSAYRSAGQPADIIRYSEEKLPAQVLDGQPAALATLAWAYSQVKDETKCFDTYDRALAMARDFPTQSLIVSQMIQVFGKEAVLTRCQGRAESDPQNVNNLEVYAHLLFMNGKQEEAIAVCERVATLATNDADAVFASVGQGMLLDSLGRYPEAKAKYEEALKRDPEQAVALNNLAYLLVERLDNPAEALPYARRAYRANPNDSGVLDTLGWTLAKNKQLGEAVGMLLRALEVDRRNTAVAYHLGLVHQLRGELEEAKERLTAAKEMAEAQGDNQTLPKIIEALKKLEERG